MIIMIRGTSGSGKTTVMREVMKHGSWTPHHTAGRKNPLYYQAHLDYPAPIVLGSYESTCGGCDNIGSAPKVYELIQTFLDPPVTTLKREYVILCEGLLLSEDTKWTGKLHDEGQDVRCLFLTTSQEECLERVKGRRREAGNEKELNPDNTVNRIGVIERARVKLTGLGVRCVRCSSSQAAAIILRWIKNG